MPVSLTLEIKHSDRAVRPLGYTQFTSIDGAYVLQPLCADQPVYSPEDRFSLPGLIGVLNVRTARAAA